MVVFGLEVDEGAMALEGTWQGQAPDGSPIASAEALVDSVAGALFAVDWPMTRFDGWYTQRSPSLDDIGVLLQRGKALSCTDAAVIPRLKAAEVTVDGASVKVQLTLGLDVFQRDETGRLAPTHFLEASAPGLVDSVEDTMISARRQSVDRVLAALPFKKKQLDHGELAADIVLTLLPPAEAKRMAEVATQSSLAVTRVASVARLAVVLPALESSAASPGVLGLQWRAEEERCYLDPPGDEDPGRALPCAVLSRVRQGVRELQLQTRRLEGFRLEAPMSERTTPLGQAEGLNVGDGYWVDTPQGKVGYARVKRVGEGGVDGDDAPSRLQIVFGPRTGVGMSVRENPQLGIEIGGAGAVLPAGRDAATLPPDPIEGGSRSLGAASIAPGGTLRFDVNLGRTAGLYELYQTNRLSRGLAGPLQHTAATFGLERRLQVLPRTSLVFGAGVTVGSWSIPSGAVRFDNDGDPHEIRASATRIGGDVEGGLSWMCTPSLMIRATGGGRLSGAVSEFSWSDEDRSGTVTPVVATGPFRLRTGGLVASLSSGWVF